MAITQAAMDTLDKQLFLPMMLLFDFYMFLYLWGVYYTRRHEFRVLLLFFGAFLAWAALVPFATDDKERRRSLNDASETCAQLMFLIQITLIGHAVQTKVKLKTIQLFTYAAELLILADWINVGMNFLELLGVQFFKEGEDEAFRIYGNVLESSTLTFVLVFRFYYLSMTTKGGFREVLEDRKVEILAYLLMVTHELPFAWLTQRTNVSWEYVQGMYMRMMIAWCILLNVINKNKSNNPRKSTTTATTTATATDGGSGDASSVVPFHRKLAAKLKSSSGGVRPAVQVQVPVHDKPDQASTTTPMTTTTTTTTTTTMAAEVAEAEVMRLTSMRDVSHRLE